jgi:hypothetical protein
MGVSWFGLRPYFAIRANAAASVVNLDSAQPAAKPRECDGDYR